MKEKSIALGFVLILCSFSLFFLFQKEKEISTFERRKLKTNQILKEDFRKNIEEYLSDQFPLRNQFLNLNTFFKRYLLNQNDTNDVYKIGDCLIEKNYPLNHKNVTNFIEKGNKIVENDLKNSQVYYAILPDKSYFLEEKHLKIDFDYLFNQLEKELKGTFIPLEDLFTLEDYYKTDIHIRQEKYPKMLERLANYMQMNATKKTYVENNYTPFYGASYSKNPLFIKPDTLTYLTNETTKESIAHHLEYGERPIYETSKLSTMDSYNIFLGGPSAYIEIENKKASTEKELIIFRDSFASSLTPLLLEYYQKITLIDLRYIKMDKVKELTDFNEKEVLFLYSTLLVNNSHLLKFQ